MSHRRRHGPRARRRRRRAGPTCADGSAGRTSDGEQTGAPECPSPADSPVASACAVRRARAGGRGRQRPSRHGPSPVAPHDTSSDSAIVVEGLPLSHDRLDTGRASARVARASWEWLVTMELRDVLATPVLTMCDVPRFLVPACLRAPNAAAFIPAERAWKLFPLVPRLLLTRPHETGAAGRTALLGDTASRTPTSDRPAAVRCRTT